MSSTHFTHNIFKTYYPDSITGTLPQLNSITCPVFPFLTLSDLSPPSTSSNQAALFLLIRNKAWIIDEKGKYPITLCHRL